jgi:hypothetical protein
MGPSYVSGRLIVDCDRAPVVGLQYLRASERPRTPDLSMRCRSDRLRLRLRHALDVHLLHELVAKRVDVGHVLVGEQLAVR